MKALAFLVSLFVASAAHAATVTIYHNGTAIAEIGCGAASCEGANASGADLDWSAGWSGTATFSATSGSLFRVHPPSDSNERDFVNDVTGGMFGNGIKDETGNAPTGSLAEYVLFKSGNGNGPSVMLIKNTSGGAIDYTFTKLLSGKQYKDIGLNGFGLSHTNSFGEISAVPVPAAGVMFGLLFAGGAVFARRRKT